MRLHHFLEYLEYIKKTTKNLSLRIPDTEPESKPLNKMHQDISRTLSFLTNSYDSYSQIDVQNLISKMSEEERDDLVNYSTEMIKNEIPIKPYDAVCISFIFKDNDHYILLVTNVEKEKDPLNEYDFLIANHGQEKDFDNVCLGGFKFADNKFWLEKPKALIPLIPETEENRKITEEKCWKYSNLALFVYLIVCAMMQSKNIETVSVSAPEKLNKSRIRKGRLPIKEINEIRINYGGKRYLANGREEGGTHASPRLHWRRGHIRRLADGKITNVRPTLVGEIKGQEPRLPTYKIVKGGQHA